MRILIVDDEPIAVTILKHALEQDGHQVVVATNGMEALAHAQTDSYRIVISDWMMPNLDGLRLCKKIRHSGLSGYVYFILLTSRNAKQDLIEGLTAGADDFLTKPFDPLELRVRVRAAERILAADTRDMALFAMAKLAESRDPETGSHLERVRVYARIIAEHLSRLPDYREEADAEFVRMIFQTSPLHDIGKIGIPDCILLKPGRLDDGEFEIMKTHTTIGAETLDAAIARYPQATFLQMARDIILTHHEKFDGSGYPNGLEGRHIPLAGRIVALADTYDAMTSRRVYKQAHSHDIALRTILAEGGKHFDADVVDAFSRNEMTFREICETIRDGTPQEAVACTTSL